MMRGGLVTLIFSKTLRLKEGEKAESRAMTLMTNDVQRIVTSLAFMHEVWAGILEATLATWLLERQVGLSSLTMVALALGK